MERYTGDETEKRFNPGSSTAASTKTLREWATFERSFLHESSYVINFSCFLGDNIGLM